MGLFDFIKGKFKKTAIIGGITASTVMGQAQSNENKIETNDEVKIEQISSIPPKMEYNFHSGKKGNISWFGNMGHSNEGNTSVSSVTDKPTASTEDVVEILSNPEYMGNHTSPPNYLNEDNSVGLENGQTVIQNEKNPNHLHFLDTQGNEESVLSIQKDSEDNLVLTKLHNKREQDDWIVDASRQDIIKKIQSDGTVLEIQENEGVINKTYQKPDGSTQKFTEVDGKISYEETKNADGTWNATRYMPDGSSEYFEKNSEGNQIRQIYDSEGKISKEYLNGELVNNNKEKESSLPQEEQEPSKQPEIFQEEKISDEKEKTLDPVKSPKDFFIPGEESSLTNKVEQVNQSNPQIESSSLQKKLEKSQASANLQEILKKSSKEGDTTQIALLKQKMKENE